MAAKLGGDAAHLGRMGVVATAPEHAAAPDRRMGPPALRRRPATVEGSAWPTSREHSGVWIGLDPAEYAPLCLRRWSTSRCRRTAFGETRARGIAPPSTGGDDGLGSGGRADASSRARLRGPAMGRSDFARSHARAGGARARRRQAAHHRDDAAGVPPVLEREGRTMGVDLASSPLDRVRRSAEDGSAELSSRHALAEGHRRRGRRAYRRRPAVRRGGDATSCWSAMRTGRRAGDPADLAAIARRAARSARRSA